MKIYAISGLGADSRVFNFLNLDLEIIPLEWISPLKKETIEHYAFRLSQKINQEEPFILMGVSFGGIMATEISKITQPIATILVSSAEIKSELRWIYNVIGKMKLIPLFPTSFFDLPRFVASWLFGTQDKQLLNEILDDTDLHFTKWAIIKLTTWKNTTRINNCYKICGSKDKLIPPNPKAPNVHYIQNGEHLMIVDKADEVSKIINEIALTCRIYS